MSFVINIIFFQISYFMCENTNLNKKETNFTIRMKKSLTLKRKYKLIQLK